MSEQHFRASLTTPDGREGEVRFVEYMPPADATEQEALYEQLRTQGGYLYENGVLVAKVGPAVAVDPNDLPPVMSTAEELEELLSEFGVDRARDLAEFLVERGVTFEE